MATQKEVDVVFKIMTASDTKIGFLLGVSPTTGQTASMLTFTMTSQTSAANFILANTSLYKGIRSNANQKIAIFGDDFVMQLDKDSLPPTATSCLGVSVSTQSSTEHD